MIVNHTYTGGTLCNSTFSHCTPLDKTRVPASLLLLTHDTYTNTNLAFLRTIYGAIDTNKIAEYIQNTIDIKKIVAYLPPTTIRIRPTVVPNSVVVSAYDTSFNSLIEVLGVFLINLKNLQSYTNFKQLFTQNTPTLDQYIFNYTDNYVVLMTNLAYKLQRIDKYLNYDIREKHGELWKKFEQDDINLIGADSFPVYICRLPTKKYVIHNEYFDNSNNMVQSKLISNYLRCYKYMLDSTPYVGDIYGTKNYEALKNAYSNSSGPTNELYELFGNFSGTASRLNAILTQLKRADNKLDNQDEINDYNNLLELFLTEAKQIYIKHKQIFTTNIWAVHESNLWIHYEGITGPNSDLTICKYKKIGDDMFFY